MKLPRYVSEFADRHGRRRYRFRKTGKPSAMLPNPNTDEAAFWLAYSEAMAATVEPKVQAPHGSLSHASIIYCASREFRGMRPSTRANYQRWIALVVDEIGQAKCAAVRRRHIVKLMDRAPSKSQSTGILRAFKILLRVAREQEWMTGDPSADIKRPRDGDGQKAWGPAQIAAFRLRWPLGTRERLAFELLLSTAQRRGDVCEMHVDQIEGDEIFVCQQKTGAEIYAQLTPACREAMEACPSVSGYLIETAAHKQRSHKAFGNWFGSAATTAIGEPGYTAHGLRKTVPTILAEDGRSEREIMAITGHKTSEQVAVYVRSANQRKLARRSRSSLEKLSNLVVKPGL